MIRIVMVLCVAIMVVGLFTDRAEAFGKRRRAATCCPQPCPTCPTLSIFPGLGVPPAITAMNVALKPSSAADTVMTKGANEKELHFDPEVLPHKDGAIIYTKTRVTFSSDGLFRMIGEGVNTSTDADYYLAFNCAILHNGVQKYTRHGWQGRQDKVETGHGHKFGLARPHPYPTEEVDTWIGLNWKNFADKTFTVRFFYYKEQSNLLAPSP